MIQLKHLLRESGLTDTLHVAGIGDVACKWDTGADTMASALHADRIQVDGDSVTWSYAGHTHTQHVVGYSEPEGKDRRPVVALPVAWRGQHITAPFALTDRSTMSTPVLCNLDLMRRLGVRLDPNSGAI
jgi:hypothetical protein